MAEIAQVASGAKFIKENPVHLLREEFYGTSGATPVDNRAIVFSYANPDVLRQAKMEAMELKIQRKMLEKKAASGDEDALRELEGNVPFDISQLTDLTDKQLKGSREQVTALVVPPALTEHGEEVRGSSTLILSGVRRDYQRLPSSARPRSAGSMPGYRTKPAGQQQQTVQDAPKRLASTQRSAGPAPEPAEAQRVTRAKPIRAQLREGMLAYVPAKVQQVDGIARNAFVTQAQAMTEARTQYETVRPRHASPTFDSYSQSAGQLQLQPGQGAGRGQGHRQALTHLRGEAAAAGGRLELPGGGAGLLGVGEDKWRNVPLVAVQETDLLAAYRKASAALAAAPAPPTPAPPPPAPPAPTSPRPLRATIRTHTVSHQMEAPGTDAGPARASAPSAAAAKSREGHGATASAAPPTRATQPAAAAGGATRRKSVTVVEPHEEAAAKAGRAPRPAAAPPAVPARAWEAPDADKQAHATVAVPRQASGGEASGGASSMGRRSGAAARRAEGAGVNVAAASTATAAAAARPASPHRAGRPPLQRAASASASSAAFHASHSWTPSHATASATAPRPPPPSRPPSANRRIASASSSASPTRRTPVRSASAIGTAPDPRLAPAGTTLTADAPRVVYEPVGADARRQLQSRPGSGVMTLKTNGRTRARPGSAMGAAPGAPTAAAASFSARAGGGSFSGGGGGSVSLSGGASAGALYGGASASQLPLASFASVDSILGAAAAGAAAGAGQAVPVSTDPWATASTSFPGASDRHYLQERILTGLAAQYVPAAGSAGYAAAAAAALATPASALTNAGRSRRPPVGMSAAEAAAALAAATHAPQSALPSDPGEGGGAGHRSRPQSAPNRRLRPPSAGHWAGRPDPAALHPLGSLPRSPTGLVYDPECQPGPLDSYMAQLVGLD